MYDKAKLSENIIKLRQGDKNAFNDIYEMTYRNALFTAKKLLNDNEDDAWDVIQESYMQVLNKIETLENPDAFSGWFNMIIVNKAKEFLRKNGRISKKTMSFDDVKVDSSDDENLTLDNVIEDEQQELELISSPEQKELSKDIMALVDALGDDRREAILLHYFNDMSVKDIAASLGVNENTVKSRLFQARKELEKGVRALEKKKGKLLGVTPISAVVWALRFTAAHSAISSTTAAATLSAVTAGTAAGVAASAGGTAAGVAGTSIAAKIIAGIVAASLVGGGVAAGVGISRNVKEKPAAPAEESTSYNQNVDDDRSDGSPEKGEEFTVSDGKLSDTAYQTEELRYGVKVSSQNYVYKTGNGTDSVRSIDVFDRSSFKASYSDLVPNVKENRVKYSSEINTVLSGINSQVSSQTPYVEDPVLSEQAGVRAEEIAWSGINNSIRPDGTNYVTVFERNGFNSGTRFESRVVGAASADDALKILNSNGEMKKIKNTAFEKIGIGVSQDPETEKLVFVIHGYSDEKSGAPETNAADEISYKLEQSTNELIGKLTDEEAIEEFEQSVYSIPILGDILGFDLPDDFLVNGFSSIVDSINDSIGKILERLSNWW